MAVGQKEAVVWFQADQKKCRYTIPAHTFSRQALILLQVLHNAVNSKLLTTQQGGERADGRGEKRPSRIITNKYRKTMHFCWWNVFNNICCRLGRSFWSWFADKNELIAVQSRFAETRFAEASFAETRFAETLILTLTLNPNFGESGFGETGRHPNCSTSKLIWIRQQLSIGLLSLHYSRVT